jgi:ABC-2 type transport system ATP-binding protein
VVHNPDRVADASALLARMAGTEPRVEERTRELLVPVTGGAKFLVETIREFDAAGIVVDDIALRRPTLDDVFLALTGRAAEESEPADTEAGDPR